MIAHRQIVGEDILRAVQINDTLLTEHSGEYVTEDLGIDAESLMVHASAYADTRDPTHESVMLAFAMGVLGGLRAVKLLAHE